ncbi:MAG TPA: cysteine hydrolase [Candidatus Avamphibacillus intestinigallinarum]|nr:cysteine hydrolase [Candidatus Avamphibacillus intestinigallinarum]
MSNAYDRHALILIDLINPFDFNGGTDLYQHTLEIVPHLNRLKDFARTHDIPIIYVNDHYEIWQSSPEPIIQYCQNEQSEQIINELRPHEDDYFLIKPFHSAFHQTPLRALLESLQKTTLILAGIAGDICILFTAQDAYMYGDYKLWVPKNCLASETKEGNNHALALLHSVTKASITPI